MTWTYKLDTAAHDLTINSDGDLEVVTGSDEVVQRIKVALWHYAGEYFTDVNKGVPYYEEILGSTVIDSKLENILRSAILEVPGVESIEVFDIRFDRSLRALVVENVRVIVQTGKNEVPGIVNINGIGIIV